MRAVELNSTTERRPTVLLVDDDSDQLFILSSFLNAQGYDVTSAQGGSAALAEMDTAQYDVVVTDICMPGMSGFELAQQVRKRDRNGTTPIVLMTAGSQPIAHPSNRFRADAFVLKKDIQRSLKSVIDSLA